ncbi:MAG: DUF177 domain-containing protein [Cyclobacteriaceae bacterium]
MKTADKYRIDIFKLSNDTHEYDFDINSEFFDLFEFSEVKEGSGNCHATLEKTPSMITMDFDINASVELVCDRSLDTFDYPINIQEQIRFKYGEEEADLSDDVKVITQSTQSINVAHYLFEMLTVVIPMKKLHPRFEESAEADDEIIYTSDKDNNDSDDDSTDPRWNALKDLNK